MKDKISIIVPIYNTEKFLDKCLNSLVNQTYKNIEIILIDDGSTDNSLNICLDYQKKDSRVIVLKQKNLGKSISRNNGINKSSGNYIMFVDSDDYIEPNMCEIMINTIKKYNVDIVRCNYRFINNKIVEDNKNFISCNKILKKNEIKEIINQMITGEVGSYIWLLIIKKSIIKDNKIIFNPKIHLMNDKPFTINLLLNINSLVQINDILYNYVRNDNGTVRSNKNLFIKIDSVLRGNECIKQILNNKNEFTKKREYLLYKTHNLILLDLLIRASLYYDNYKNLIKKFKILERNPLFKTNISFMLNNKLELKRKIRFYFLYKGYYKIFIFLSQFSSLNYQKIKNNWRRYEKN